MGQVTNVKPLAIHCAEVLHEFGHAVTSIIANGRHIETQAVQHDIMSQPLALYAVNIVASMNIMFVGLANLRAVLGNVLQLNGIAVVFQDE